LEISQEECADQSWEDRHLINPHKVENMELSLDLALLICMLK